MNERLRKKCFIASAGFHLTLLVVLFFGSGFLASQNKSEVQMITFVPMILTDANVAGGGSPTGQTPPPNPTPPPPTPPTPTSPTPTQRREPPTPVKPAETEPVKTRVNTDKTDPHALETKTAKKPVVSLKPITRNNTKTVKPTARPSSEDDPNAKAEADRKRIASNIARNLRENLSPGANVQVPRGPGGGGPTYASYYMEVQRICKQRYDAALLAAGDIAQEQTSLEVALTLASDGSVLSVKLVTPSSNATLNRLVKERVLAASFPPFPTGATESQRTINIVFDLKPKKAIG